MFSESGHYYLLYPLPVLSVRTALPVLPINCCRCQDIITCSTHTLLSLSGVHYLSYPHPILCVRTLLPVPPTPHSLCQDSTQSWSCPCWLTADAAADSVLHLLHTGQDSAWDDSGCTDTAAQVCRGLFTHIANCTAHLLTNWFLSFFFFFILFITILPFFCCCCCCYVVSVYVNVHNHTNILIHIVN